MPRANLAAGGCCPGWAHAVVDADDASQAKIRCNGARPVMQVAVGRAARHVRFLILIGGMIGLRDGTLLMACNPIGGNRNRLAFIAPQRSGSGMDAEGGVS